MIRQNPLLRKVRGRPAIPPMITANTDTVTTMVTAMITQPVICMGMILPIIPIRSPIFPAVPDSGTGQRRNAGRAC